MIAATLSLSAIRADFPILQTQVNGKPLVYLDNGATSQKPKQVIEAISQYYEQLNSNVHRGVHSLSQHATDAYEESRKAVQQFIHAREDREIIFTRGTTESINLVAQSWGTKNLSKGRNVVVSAMEHHANIVPWQMVCEATGAELRVLPMDQSGTLIEAAFEKMIDENTAMLACIHVSNALGTINPVKQLTAIARKHGALVLLDGAQAVPHMAVDVQALDCDFYVFSGHKMLGPTGIGVLYGKAHLLEAMPPYQGGGDMIKSVTFEKTTFNELPFKFEAGTPHIEGAIVLKTAIDYLQNIGYEAIEAYETELYQYAMERLSEVEGIRFIGTAKAKVPVISFLIDGLHPYDVGFILDKQGIAVRTGHHCAQPVMDFLNIPGTLRASLAFYNTMEEMDRLCDALRLAKKMLA